MKRRATVGEGTSHVPGVRVAQKRMVEEKEEGSRLHVYRRLASRARASKESMTVLH